jgi:hypothetical protein
MALYNKHFYNKMLRKYVVAFGSLFNNLYVTREANGVEQQREKVPLTYAPKEKFLVRLAQDANLDEKPAIKLPRLAFEITGINYAPERKTHSLRKCLYKGDGTNPTYHYNPVPYDINFTLYFMSKSHDDGLQIVEQIAPFFTPHYSVTINAVEDLKVDLPISLVSITQEDTYDGSFEERRLIVWTLDFVLKGVLIGPVRNAGLIKTVKTTFINPETQEPYSTVDVRATNIVSPDEFDIDVNILVNDGAFSTKDLLQIKQGEDFSVDLVLTDENDVPIDLSTSTVSATIQKDSAAIDVTNFTVTKSTDPDFVGTVTLSLDAVQTSQLELGYNIYEVVLDDGQSLTTVVAGYAFVS